MTREDRLWTMKGCDLIVVADRLGVKVSCNKARTQLKESKENAIKKILAAENKEADPSSVESKPSTSETDLSTNKRGALITYNGKSQNLCAWAKELGISANTLYGRLYKFKWPVEKAFKKSR